MQKTICVDIDGTLVHYEEWQGEKHFGKVLPGACEAMKNLHESGWFVIIYTTRANKEIISSFLRQAGIYFDAINENPFQPANAIGGKPIADVYIDDRAVTFKGDWKESVKQINNFKPWE